MHSSKQWSLGCSRNSLGTSKALKKKKKTQIEMKIELSKISKNLQRIIVMPEGEEEEQEIENLFEKNNEGEPPQSDKGNRLPGSPGSSESPTEVGPKEAHTKAHHNHITQD